MWKVFTFLHSINEGHEVFIHDIVIFKLIMKDKYLVFIIVLFVIAILYGLWPLYCKFNPAQNKLNTSVEAINPDGQFSVRGFYQV